jgi:mRNA interferase MazF
MKRGQIWWVDLAEPRGSQPGFRRPVLIVQDDLLTDSLLGTVMVAPVTSNLQRGLAVGNVEITAAQSGLPERSVVLVCQVMAVDKSFFSEQQGPCPVASWRKWTRGSRWRSGYSADVSETRTRAGEPKDPLILESSSLAISARCQRTLVLRAQAYEFRTAIAAEIAA